jgi:WD40 repeat protein
VNAAAPIETVLVFDEWLFAGTQAAGGRQGFVKVWHMGNGFEQTLEGHTGAVFSLAQGGAYLFSAGEDMGIKTWRFGESQQFEPVVELQGHAAPVQVLKAAPNCLISGDRNGVVNMWDLTSGQQTGSIQTGHTREMLALWVEESHLITAALDGNVRVWDASGTGLYEHQVENKDRQPSGVTALCVVPEGEGSTLITACDDNVRARPAAARDTAALCATWARLSPRASSHRRR